MGKAPRRPHTPMPPLRCAMRLFRQFETLKLREVAAALRSTTVSLLFRIPHFVLEFMVETSDMPGRRKLWTECSSWRCRGFSV